MIRLDQAWWNAACATAVKRPNAPSSPARSASTPSPRTRPATPSNPGDAADPGRAGENSSAGAATNSNNALLHFNLDVTSLTALDLGASTGGFTDCLLQHGAAKVFAVDVGQGQLAWKLRGDPRVIVMEKTNARYLKTRKLFDSRS